MTDGISDVRVEPLTSYEYVRPQRMHFKLNGKQRFWDYVQVHDSVSCILYHKDRRALVFVKQFRPAVYISRIPAMAFSAPINVEKYPASLGYTYELCAGIIDKSKSLNEIVQIEILEECGYNVPLSGIERVTSVRTNVGTSGSLGTMFYAEIDDSMKESEGGGNLEENEDIEVVYFPVSEVKQRLIFDEELQKPTAVLFAVMWFFENKMPPSCK